MLSCCLGAIAGKQKNQITEAWDLFPIPPLLVVSHGLSPGPLASFCSILTGQEHRASSIPAPVVQEGLGAAGGWWELEMGCKPAWLPREGAAAEGRWEQLWV